MYQDDYTWPEIALVLGVVWLALRGTRQADQETERMARLRREKEAPIDATWEQR